MNPGKMVVSRSLRAREILIEERFSYVDELAVRVGQGSAGTVRLQIGRPLAGEERLSMGRAIELTPAEAEHLGRLLLEEAAAATGGDIARA